MVFMDDVRSDVIFWACRKVVQRTRVVTVVGWRLSQVGSRMHPSAVKHLDVEAVTNAHCQARYRV